jgi:hypothetical protein
VIGEVVCVVHECLPHAPPHIVRSLKTKTDLALPPLPGWQPPSHAGVLPNMRQHAPGCVDRCWHVAQGVAGAAAPPDARCCSLTAVVRLLLLGERLLLLLRPPAAAVELSTFTRDLNYCCQTCPYVYKIDRRVSGVKALHRPQSCPPPPPKQLFCGLSGARPACAARHTLSNTQVSKAAKLKRKEVDDVLGDEAWKNGQKTDGVWGVWLWLCACRLCVGAAAGARCAGCHCKCCCRCHGAGGVPGACL